MIDEAKHQELIRKMQTQTAALSEIVRQLDVGELIITRAAKHTRDTCCLGKNCIIDGDLARELNYYLDKCPHGIYLGDLCVRGCPGQVATRTNEPAADRPMTAEQPCRCGHLQSDHRPETTFWANTCNWCSCDMYLPATAEPTCADSFHFTLGGPTSAQCCPQCSGTWKAPHRNVAAARPVTAEPTVSEVSIICRDCDTLIGGVEAGAAVRWVTCQTCRGKLLQKREPTVSDNCVLCGLPKAEHRVGGETRGQCSYRSPTLRPYRQRKRTVTVNDLRRVLDGMDVPEAYALVDGVYDRENAGTDIDAIRWLLDELERRARSGQ